MNVFKPFSLKFLPRFTFITLLIFFWNVIFYICAAERRWRRVVENSESSGCVHTEHRATGGQHSTPALCQDTSHRTAMVATDPVTRFCIKLIIFTSTSPTTLCDNRPDVQLYMYASFFALIIIWWTVYLLILAIMRGKCVCLFCLSNSSGAFTPQNRDKFTKICYFGGFKVIDVNIPHKFVGSAYDRPTQHVCA